MAFGGGRLAAGKALLHVRDYLGSVRAVIDGSTGTIYKAADYSAFGAESPAGSMQIVAIPNNAHPLTTITLRDGYTGKEDQTPEFGTGYIDFGARQYSPTLRRWMTPDPMSEKYYGTSPYAFCGNNPVRFADDNGEDWHDKVVGYFVGGVTNVVPGTGFIRDWYSPDNSADYNSALKRTDEAAAVMGTGMMKAGTGTMAAGGVLATAGVGVTASTAGVGVVVGGPVVAAGAEMAAVGAATAATGGVLVMNSSKNKSDGYERGKSNVSSGNKNSRHANLKANASAKEKYESAKKQYEEMRSKPNKTPEDRRQESIYKKLRDHWKSRMDFKGENHSQNAKGNR